MKYTILPIKMVLGIAALGFMVSGCAEPAFYADREHGIASSAAFDQQIVHKDYKYAGKPVEGLDAIYAENVMGRYLETFKEGFTKEDFEITETGLED
jgi:hypothetical protein